MPSYICKKETFCFEQLPFYWHPLSSKEDKDFNKAYPFSLTIDKTIGHLKQIPSQEILNALTIAYNKGSDIAGLMDSEGIGCQYASDFLNFTNNTVGISNIKNKDILEIGCGTGYLLHTLKEHQANVLGYEPGYSKIGKFSVPVIENFFPSVDIKNKKFDIIIAYQVLEHIVDINNILTQINLHLKDSGTCLLSVPDCTECIKNGDISMLIHEHFSYFTKMSFTAILKAHGFIINKIEKSSFGGCLYACITKDKSFSNNVSCDRDSLSMTIFPRINKNIESMQKYLESNNNNTLGVFVPIRAMNIFSLFTNLIKDLNISLRLFDDSQGLKGKYLPGINAEIEDRNALISSPPNSLLIYSYSFGDQIYEELINVLPKETNIRIIGKLGRVAN